MANSGALHYDILILGGGFSGVYCAKALSKQKQFCRDHRIAIVSDENYMVFQPMLAEVASASISPRHVINPIRQMCRGVDVFRAKTRAIEPTIREVRVNAGAATPDVPLRYDHLVVCLGSIVDLTRIPGMSEHALLMANVGDAMKLRSTIISRFEEANITADRDLRRRLLNFVVVGGGYSGVETAGEIQDMMSSIHRFYSNIHATDFRVVLVHSGETILESMSRELGEYAQRKLSARGVDIRLGERVTAVTAQCVSLRGGPPIEAANVVSTIGNSPNPVVLDLIKGFGLEAERGRLLCEATGLARGQDRLWAAGDCAALPLKDGEGAICPPTAQFAQRQGTLVGQNLLALYRRKPPKPFSFTGLGELAAIGHRTAVASIFGKQLSGFAAWWLWRTIYLLKLPGLQRKLRVMVDWTLDLFFPRDINLLNPSSTRLLQKTYLDTGDTLYHPGEPASSLYFVKSGNIRILDNDRLVKEIRGGDYFGERALLGDGIWRYRAVATEPTLLVGLGQTEFKAILEGSHDLRALFERSSRSYLSSEQLESLRSQVSNGKLQRSVAAVMNSKIDALRADMNLRQALAVLREERHGSYPLLDSEGKLLGMLNRDDIYDHLKATGDLDGPIDALPPRRLPLIQEEANVEQALETLQSSGRNKALVVSNEGALRGLVTWIDLIS